MTRRRGHIHVSLGRSGEELEEYAMHALECRAAAAKSSNVAEQECLSPPSRSAIRPRSWCTA
jgi:hypothetical protein